MPDRLIYGGGIWIDQAARWAGAVFRLTRLRLRPTLWRAQGLCLWKDEFGLITPSGVWRIYDTRRNRNLLERPTQSEVGSLLLLQGRSTSDRAKASEMDGLDGQCSPPERNPGSVALFRLFGCSNTHRGCQGSGDWRPACYRCGSHHRRVLTVRLFVFTHGMRTFTILQPTPQSPRR
jgi:hypothetical protein